MPSLSEFRIEFGRPGATYMPGEIVTGNVIVSVNRRKNIRALKFTAKGEAFVHWTSQVTERDANQRQRTRTVHFTERETYFHLSHILLGGEGNTREDIPTGHHIYPFTYQLPYNIPSSFEHRYGHIRYTIKAVIDRPWKFDHECKAAFTVVSLFDLNLHRNECVELKDEFKKTFYSFCCINKGVLQGNVNIPTTGYVPGQPLLAVVRFENSSTSVRLTSISMKLEQILKFHASSGASQRTKLEKNEVSETEAAQSFSSQGEVTVQLTVPPLPPTQLQYCNIIEILYRVKIGLHVSGLHSKVSRSYPVTIGSIPLRIMPTAPPAPEVPPALFPNYVQGQAFPVPMPMPNPGSARPSYAHEESTGGFNDPRVSHPMGFTLPDGSSAVHNWDMPPPSYQECMTGTATIRDDDESSYVYGADTPFAPRYPVFKFPAPDTSK